MITEQYIEHLNDYLSELADYLHNTKNCIEKINILTKISELVFWLQMYSDEYLKENKS